MLDNVSWLVPEHILCAYLSGTVNREQIQQLNQTCFDLLAAHSGLSTVHIIIDVSEVKHYDRDMMHVELLQNAIDPQPLVDWVIVVDPFPNAIVRFVGLALISLLKFRCHVTRTHDDTVAFIMPKLRPASGKG